MPWTARRICIADELPTPLLVRREEKWTARKAALFAHPSFARTCYVFENLQISSFDHSTPQRLVPTTAINPTANRRRIRFPRNARRICQYGRIPLSCAGKTGLGHAKMHNEPAPLPVVELEQVLHPRRGTPGE
jgi:hypothetical protein